MARYPVKSESTYNSSSTRYNKRRKGQTRTRTRTRNKKRKSFKSWTDNIRSKSKNRQRQSKSKDRATNETDEPRPERLRYTDGLITKADPYNWQLKTSPNAASSFSESLFDRSAVPLKELSIRKIVDNVEHLDEETMAEIPASIARDLWFKILKYQCDSHTVFMNFALRYHNEDWFCCWVTDLGAYSDSMFLGLRRELLEFNQRHRVFPLFNQITFHRFVNNLNRYQFDPLGLVQVVEVRKKINKEDLEYLFQTCKYLRSLRIDHINKDLITGPLIHGLCLSLKNGKLPMLQMLSLPELEEQHVIDLQKAAKLCQLEYIEVSSNKYINIKRECPGVNQTNWEILEDFSAGGVNLCYNVNHQTFPYNPSDSWGIKTTKFYQYKSLLHPPNNTCLSPLIIHYIATSAQLGLNLEKKTEDAKLDEFDELWNQTPSSHDFHGKSKSTSYILNYGAFYLRDVTKFKESQQDGNNVALNKQKRIIGLTGVKTKPVIRKYINMNSFFD